MKSIFAHRTLFSCLVLSGLVQAAPPLPGALPTGGAVSSGQASISTAGSSMTVNQSTNRAAINWDTFNVGQNATVNFIQPNAQSATLNRVIGNSPSQIFGQIHANGQVYLLNQAGIYFSPSAIVDVNSIVATTHQLSDADFMAGKSSFTRNGSAASVVNDGYISSGIGGYIALLAPEVRNNGVVIARQGTVAMASGEVITLNFGLLSKLESVAVSPGDINSLVANNHAVIAPDGLVILSARAMNQLASQVIQNGTIEAKGISNQGGRIVLDSGGNGYSEVSGILDTSSIASKGGRIEVLGQNVRVKNTSTLNASGATGGGEILVGGSWQNSDPAISQATTTNIELGANLQANATDSGNGGTIVAWSDVTNPNSQTTVAGNLQAKGGINGGDGGRIETSGYQINIESASVNASASTGNSGLWLIDPALVTIDQATANVFSNTLSTGANVFVSNPTSGGDIATAPGVSISKTAGGNTFFKLQADGSITLADQTSIQSSFGTLDVILNSNSAGGGGAVSLTNATINTNGGVFTLGGNPNPLIGVARGTLNQIVGASIDGGSIFTGGGNISIRGQGYAGTPSTPITATNSSFGVRIGQNAVINSGGGNISIAGFTSVLNSNAFSHAVMFGDQGSVSGGASILSGSGNINISGTTSGGGNYSNGIYFQSSLANPVTISATGAGTVSLSGSTNNPTHLENHGVFFEEGAQRVSTQNGLLSITGQGSGTNGFGVAFQHNIGSNNTVIGSSTQVGNIDFNADSLFFASTTNATIQGLGNLTFKPTTSTTPIEIGTASTTAKLVVPSLAFDSQISNGFSNITIGSNTSSGSITTAANITPQDNLELVSGTGAIQISNAINAGSNTLTLNSSGAITESGTGSIAADKLLILGATGSSTLQASNNSVNVLAANTGSLAYTNAGPLTIGTVGTTSGITASGAVDIATQSGNLTLANSVSSGSSASNAIVLTAGKNYAAGDVNGGDITATSGVAINVAAGGSAKLYTGSFFDSTGLVDLVNAGGGSYRFNSSQTSSDFTTPLGPGVSAIYRDPFAPTLIASASSEVLSTTPSLAPILPDVSDVNIISSNANVNTVEGVGKGAGGPGDGAGPGNGAGQGKGSQGKSAQGKGASGNNAASSNSVEVSAPDVVEQTSNANVNTVEGVGRGAGGPGDGAGPGNGAGQGKGAPGNNAIAPSSVDTSVPDASGQTSNSNVNTVEGVGKGAGGPGDGSGPGNGAGQGRGSGNNPASANSAEISAPEASARTSNANVNTVEGVGRGAGGPGDGAGPGNGAGQGRGSSNNNGNNQGHNQGHGGGNNHGNNQGHGNSNHGHNQGHGSNPPPRNPPANNPPATKPPTTPGKPSNPVTPSGPTPPKTPTTPTVPGGPTPPVTPPEIVPPLVPPVVPPYVGPTPPKTPTTPTVPGGPTTSNTTSNTPVAIAARNASAVGNQIPYDELSVSLTRKVSPNDGGLVSVLVPKSLINNQQEFSFKLPKEVADLVDKSSNVRAITNDGKELPSWLSFDKKNESFSAASSANRVLPIRVLINTDSGTTVMNISVREGP